MGPFVVRETWMGWRSAFFTAVRLSVEKKGIIPTSSLPMSAAYVLVIFLC